MSNNAFVIAKQRWKFVVGLLVVTLGAAVILNYVFLFAAHYGSQQYLDRYPVMHTPASYRYWSLYVIECSVGMAIATYGARMASVGLAERTGVHPKRWTFEYLAFVFLWLSIMAVILFPSWIRLRLK